MFKIGGRGLHNWNDLKHFFRVEWISPILYLITEFYFVLIISSPLFFLFLTIWLTSTSRKSMTWTLRVSEDAYNPKAEWSFRAFACLESRMENLFWEKIFGLWKMTLFFTIFPTGFSQCSYGSCVITVGVRRSDVSKFVSTVVSEVFSFFKQRLFSYMTNFAFFVGFFSSILSETTWIGVILIIWW